MFLQSYAWKSSVPLSDKLNSMFHAFRDILFLFYFVSRFLVCCSDVTYICFADSKLELTSHKSIWSRNCRNVVSEYRVRDFFPSTRINIRKCAFPLLHVTATSLPDLVLSNQLETPQMSRNESRPIARIYLLNLFKVTRCLSKLIGLPHNNETNEYPTIPTIHPFTNNNNQWYQTYNLC